VAASHSQLKKFARLIHHARKYQSSLSLAWDDGWLKSLSYFLSSRKDWSSLHEDSCLVFKLHMAEH
jgi:hypothetical protein